MVELIEERGIRIGGEHVSLVVGVFDDRLRVSNTTADQDRGTAAKPCSRDRAGPVGRTIGSSDLRRAMASRVNVKFSAEQKAAIFALGQGGRLTLLTGAAGVGKTTLLEPVVAAWKAD